MVRLFYFLAAIICSLLLISACGRPVCVAPKADAKKYLVIDTFGGLGNRVIALASGQAVAEQTGRTLALWWDPAPQELPAEFNELFSNKVLSLENITMPQGWQPIDILDRKIVCNSQVERWDFKNDKYEDLVQLLKSDVPYVVVRPVRPFGTKENPAQSFEKYVANMNSLTPVDDIKNIVENFWQKHFAHKRVVGVHYRSWVLTADLMPHVKNANLEVFIQKMHDALNKDPDTVFYVASDNLDISAKLAQAFPEKVVRYPLFSVERGTLDDAKNSLIEWLLLGRADYIIGTYQSTFSASAAMRTKERRDISIGPYLGGTIGELFCFDKDGFVDKSNWNVKTMCTPYYPN